MSAPTVSVVMAAYNNEQFVGDAIDSILRQTWADLELIVIDDGSTDGTAGIVRGYADARLELIQNPGNTGLARSLNRGLRAARGEFVARQDADDSSLPGRLAAQLSYFRQHPGVGLLGTAYHVVGPASEHARTRKPPPTDTGIRWQMLFHNAFCHSSVMFRRNLLASPDSFYDESLPYSQDYDMWARMLGRTRAANLEAASVVWRKHATSISTQRRAEQQAIASAIAARQLSALGAACTPAQSQIDVLRSWFQRFPRRLAGEDIPTCLLLFQLLACFQKQPAIDPTVVRGIRRKLTRRTLDALPLSEMGAACAAGLCGQLIRDNRLHLAADLLFVAKRRAARALRGARPPVPGHSSML